MTLENQLIVLLAEIKRHEEYSRNIINAIDSLKSDLLFDCLSDELRTNVHEEIIHLSKLHTKVLEMYLEASSKIITLQNS